MSVRVRLIYEKRRGACFVPHIALATLFTRAANRAGIDLQPTEGFSPHAKMSFGPELPAGVVALAEPVDVWLRVLPEGGLPALLSSWDAQMPEGFRIKDCALLPPESPALGKDCQAAHYLLWGRKTEPFSQELLHHLKNHYGEDVLSALVDEFSRVSTILAGPAKNGIGSWVKALAASGLVAGWQDLCIVRAAIGRWNPESRADLRVETLGLLQ